MVSIFTLLWNSSLELFVLQIGSSISIEPQLSLSPSSQSLATTSLLSAPMNLTTLDTSRKRNSGWFFCTLRLANPWAPEFDLARLPPDSYPHHQYHLCCKSQTHPVGATLFLVLPPATLLFFVTLIKFLNFPHLHEGGNLTCNLVKVKWLDTCMWKYFVNGQVVY